MHCPDVPKAALHMVRRVRGLFHGLSYKMLSLGAGYFEVTNKKTEKPSAAQFYRKMEKSTVLFGWS